MGNKKIMELCLKQETRELTEEARKFGEDYCRVYETENNRTIKYPEVFAAYARGFFKGYMAHKNKKRKKLISVSKKTRPMTRDEIIFFVKTSPCEIKVAYTYIWGDRSRWDINGMLLESYQWAKVNEDGTLGEPQKFEVEV